MKEQGLNPELVPLDDADLESVAGGASRRPPNAPFGDGANRGAPPAATAAAPTAPGRGLRIAVPKASDARSPWWRAPGAPRTLVGRKVVRKLARLKVPLGRFGDACGVYAKARDRRTTIARIVRAQLKNAEGVDASCYAGAHARTYDCTVLITNEVTVGGTFAAQYEFELDRRRRLLVNTLFCRFRDDGSFRFPPRAR